MALPNANWRSLLSEHVTHRQHPVAGCKKASCELWGSYFSIKSHWELLSHFLSEIFISIVYYQVSVSNQSAVPSTNSAEHRKTTALSKIRLINTSWNSLHQSLSRVSIVSKPNCSHFKPKCEMPSQTPEGDTQGITAHPHLTQKSNNQL